ncbi:ABC transporter permease [Methanobrevibacter olleyae]|uniref:ABC transporter permease protein n=1 Tax=Methanobrevibacter olleyae TaxID=294671 RepID=A0A126R108_METOL|nr:ABC transporter permease [Methanobrevibacter olleyae]AMK15315.1 ABC transporter permease protein [Methanobrevibacter olleyae]
MKFNRIFAVSKRIFADMKNDKRTIGLIILAPILTMSVFGIAFSGDVENVDVIVVNHDEGFTVPGEGFKSLSQDILSNIDDKTINIQYMDNENHALDKVEKGEAYAVIIFPSNFTKDVFLGVKNSNSSKFSDITVKADESIVNIKNAIYASLTDAQKTTFDKEGFKSPIKINEDPVYGKNAEFIDFFVPGIMSFVVYILTTLLTLISFVGERVSGTLERILATPITETEVILGYGIAFSIIGIIQSAILIIIGILVFNIAIVGNVLLAILGISILAIVCQSLGILLSNLADRVEQAIQFIPFVVLPAFLLSGIFWPIEAIPQWLRPLSYLIPPTYAARASRAVMIKGWGIDMIWMDLLALTIFAFIFLTMAVYSLKTKKG